MNPPKYRVLWSESARADLEAVITYIALDKTTTALNTLRKIRRKVSGLETFPERGRLVPELKEQSISLYREMIISPWRIMYRILGQTVLVLAVVDSRRNVEDLLLERFIRLPEGPEQ